MPDHMVKGNLAEQIIAALHNEEGVVVTPKAKLPSRANPKNTREIDVLITGQLLGRPMHLAFESKNYGQRIGVGRIDEFKGKLEDVEIPVQYGIFVSANGFTQDAQDRARVLGMRLLLLEGLTRDRLRTEVHDAFQSLVYLLLTVKSITITNDSPSGTADEMLFLRDGNGNLQGGILDLIWAKWRDGQIPTSLGDHELDVKIPPGWKWFVGGKEMPSAASAIVAVSGHVITIKGQAEQLALRDVSDGTIDRGRISATFDIGQSTFPVQTARTEDELQALLSPSGLAHVTVGRIPLPRIRYNIYWPPSDRVGRLLFQELHELVLRGKPLGSLANIPFSALEGTDLSTVWEPITSAHPTATDEKWPWTRKRRLIANPAMRRSSKTKRLQ